MSIKKKKKESSVLKGEEDINKEMFCGECPNTISKCTCKTKKPMNPDTLNETAKYWAQVNKRNN
jgi:hypothetical protein